MYLSASDVGLSLSIGLPEPVGDVHHFSGRYRGVTGSNMDINYEAKYEAEESRKRFASRGQYRNVTDLQGLFRVEWGPDVRTDAVEANLQMLRKGLRKEFSARVATPIHLEDSLKASGHFDLKDIYQIIGATLYIPASQQVADAKVAFSSLANTKGMFNCSTKSFLNVSWIQGDFDFSTNG